MCPTASPDDVTHEDVATRPASRSSAGAAGHITPRYGVALRAIEQLRERRALREELLDTHFGEDGEPFL
jgi:hypothetical protein